MLYGDTPGLGVLELDMESGLLMGTAYLYPQDVQIVPAAIKLTSPAMLGSHSFSDLPILQFSPDLGRAITRDEMARLFPLSDVSDTADATITFNGSNVFVSFRTPLTTGFGNLVKAHSQPSGLTPLALSWEQFRDHIFSWPNRDAFVFRGQSSTWPLRSSFHRSFKKNLERYHSLLIPEAHRALANKIEKLDLMNAVDVGCLYSILQHHGYPTPMLDWSKSPFVAAHFAFEGASDPAATVRIFMLDRQAWSRMLQQNHLTMTRPHFSFIDLLPRDNDRAAPQQSVFTVTTVDDIEAHILATERATSQSYLWAIDIPASDREKALKDLDGMGINRSHLFPDRDGICQTLRAKHFGF